MDTPNLTYACRLQPLAPEYSFELEPNGLLVERAGKTVRVAYRDIVSVRLSFLPRGLHSTGFRTRIDVAGMKPITLDDSTFTTGFLQEKRAAAYRAFVTELVERVRRANPRAPIVGGRPFWPQAATILFAIVFSLLLLAPTLKALASGHWGSGLMMAAFVAVFMLWSWRYVTRNDFRDLGKTGIPADLLPPSA